MAGSEDEDLGDLNEDVEDCNDDYYHNKQENKKINEKIKVCLSLKEGFKNPGYGKCP